MRAGTAATGKPLLHYIPGDSATDSSSTPVAAHVESPTASPALATAPQAANVPIRSGKALATPATRAVAREHGIDLATVAGTGRGGRVTKEDVVALLSVGGDVATTTRRLVSNRPSTTAATVVPVQGAPPRGTAAAGVHEDRVEPIKGIQKAMFTQMTLAHEVPAFRFCDEVRMDSLMSARQTLKPLANKCAPTSLARRPVRASLLGFECVAAPATQPIPHLPPGMAQRSSH